MTLAELAARYRGLAQEADRTGAVAPLAKLYEAVAADLAGVEGPDPAPPAGAVDLIPAAAAAKRLGVDRSWIYRHREELPFTVYVGARLMVNPVKLDKYIANGGRHPNTR